LFGQFETQWADGILGMKANDDSSYWKQLWRSGGIRSQAFSLCFSHEDGVNLNERQAGVMVLGNRDNSRLHDTPMVYAKMTTSDGGFYGLHLEQIHLRLGGGSSVISVPGSDVDYRSIAVLYDRHVIVDSGTSHTYFSEDLDSPFRDAWRRLTGDEYDTRGEYTLTELSTLPTILLQFTPDKRYSTSILFSRADHPLYPALTGTGLDESNPDSVLVAFPPSQYMSMHSFSPGVYRPRIYFHQSRNSMQVLGANFMQGKDLQFDIDRMRLGFAESTCNYSEVEVRIEEEANAFDDQGSVLLNESANSASYLSTNDTDLLLKRVHKNQISSSTPTNLDWAQATSKGNAASWYVSPLPSTTVEDRTRIAGTVLLVSMVFILLLLSNGHRPSLGYQLIDDGDESEARIQSSTALSSGGYSD
jgi:hypothetical protein